MNRWLLLILLLRLGLGLAYAGLVPLGEAPDEPAQLQYARYIAEAGGLPTTLAERQAAGYRSVWPPLYHFLLIPALTAGDADSPPTRLKAVGDTPRRLIPTNGQTIAAFIHTADESWPWRGISLAWHMGRLVSVLLSTLALIPTYLIARRLTRRTELALAATALQAVIPQALFIGGVIQDDNLLILLSGLVWLALVNHMERPGLRSAFGAGLLLGLALTAKYNALPLIGLAMAAILLSGPFSRAWPGRKAGQLLALAGGAILTGGWWFGFAWWHFNRIAAEGLISGSLAALSAGTADATLRRLGGGGGLSLPALVAWMEWAGLLFRSFWGLFGGGGTIELPGWLYGLLALLSLAALGGWLIRLRREPRPALATWPILIAPLFFLPLPLIRFLAGGGLVETAQGRHLFPALPVICLILVWGWDQLPAGRRRRAAFILPGLLLPLSLYSLGLIRAAYPPPIPLRTTPEAATTAARPVEARLTESLTLLGYELAPAQANILPVTLLWRAEAIPAEDYLVELRLMAGPERPVGGWIGHPVGGRYPTRAWDAGDILRDRIPLPFVALTGAATLTLRLLSGPDQPATAPLPLTTVALPAADAESMPPARLRADGLPPAAPFGYRGTISYVDPGLAAAPRLIGPDGRAITPTRRIAGSVAHFIVAADWPGGEYRLSGFEPVRVENRPRRFEPPPVGHPLNANFAGQITLLGYDLPRRRVEPGDSFPVTLYLRADRPIGQNLVIFNHLLDADAMQRGGADRIPQQYYTTLLWVPAEIVIDSYPVPVDADAPPGVYWLDVGFYPADRPAASLPRLAEGRPLESNSVRLGPLKVGGPPPGLTVSQARPEQPLDRTFGGQISLLGYSLTGTLTLYWRAETMPAADYTVFVHLLDETGQLVAQADGPPAAGRYPTSLWDPGEIILDRRPLPDLPPGRYAIQLGLYQPETGQRLPLPAAPDGVLELGRFRRPN